MCPGKPRWSPRQPSLHLRRGGRPAQRGKTGGREYIAGAWDSFCLLIIVWPDGTPEGASSSIPYRREMGRSVLQIQPLVPTGTPRHALPERPESGARGELAGAAAGIWQNWSCTVEQGSVWEMPEYLQMPSSCEVKMYALKVKQMTAQ